MVESDEAPALLAIIGSHLDYIDDDQSPLLTQNDMARLDASSPIITGNFSAPFGYMAKIDSDTGIQDHSVIFLLFVKRDTRPILLGLIRTDMPSSSRSVGDCINNLECSSFVRDSDFVSLGLSPSVVFLMPTVSRCVKGRDVFSIYLKYFSVRSTPNNHYHPIGHSQSVDIGDDFYRGFTESMSGFATLLRRVFVSSLFRVSSGRSLLVRLWRGRSTGLLMDALKEQNLRAYKSVESFQPPRGDEQDRMIRIVGFARGNTQVDLRAVLLESLGLCFGEVDATIYDSLRSRATNIAEKTGVTLSSRIEEMEKAMVQYLSDSMQDDLDKSALTVDLNSFHSTHKNDMNTRFWSVIKELKAISGQINTLGQDPTIKALYATVRMSLLRVIEDIESSMNSIGDYVWLTGYLTGLYSVINETGNRWTKWMETQTEQANNVQTSVIRTHIDNVKRKIAAMERIILLSDAESTDVLSVGSRKKAAAHRQYLSQLNKYESAYEAWHKAINMVKSRIQSILSVSPKYIDSFYRDPTLAKFDADVDTYLIMKSKYKTARRSVSGLCKPEIYTSNDFSVYRDDDIDLTREELICVISAIDWDNRKGEDIEIDPFSVHDVTDIAAGLTNQVAAVGGIGKPHAEAYFDIVDHDRKALMVDFERAGGYRVVNSFIATIERDGSIDAYVSNYISETERKILYLNDFTMRVVIEQPDACACLCEGKRFLARDMKPFFCRRVKFPRTFSARAVGRSVVFDDDKFLRPDCRMLIDDKARLEEIEWSENGAYFRNPGEDVSCWVIWHAYSAYDGDDLCEETYICARVMIRRKDETFPYWSFINRGDNFRSDYFISFYSTIETTIDHYTDKMNYKFRATKPPPRLEHGPPIATMVSVDGFAPYDALWGLSYACRTDRRKILTSDMLLNSKVPMRGKKKDLLWVLLYGGNMPSIVDLSESIQIINECEKIKYRIHELVSKEPRPNRQEEELIAGQFRSLFSLQNRFNSVNAADSYLISSEHLEKIIATLKSLYRSTQ